ncbi:MOSC domain-containing protein [Stenoxybacter acetivorans]|uniref:MOSC domain-containing protein n=1 Tax=Stenoxybacter acetivorans TaxID=422441 RepID=UPI00055CCDA5|nr:MOSC domain-containing protein [Stenoxybacter acetivorans]
MQITALNYYPVKSMRGIGAWELTVTPRGFEQDRIWLLADETGKFITARTVPKLVLWDALPTATGLCLKSPQGEEWQVNAADYTLPHEVTVWKDHFTAYRGAAETDHWLSEQLGMACRLVYLGAHSARRLAHDNHELSFADGAPYLLTNTASLDKLNQQLDKAVDMRRFRANIVVNGDVAYAEDNWRRIRIGECEFENFKPCSRCVLTTVDPDTGIKDEQQQPLATLAKTRKSEHGVCFGVNLALIRGGTVRVGDAVEVIAVM